MTDRPFFAPRPLEHPTRRLTDEEFAELLAQSDRDHARISAAITEQLGPSPAERWRAMPAIEAHG